MYQQFERPMTEQEHQILNERLQRFRAVAQEISMYAVLSIFSAYFCGAFSIGAIRDVEKNGLTPVVGLIAMSTGAVAFAVYFFRASKSQCRDCDTIRAAKKLGIAIVERIGTVSRPIWLRSIKLGGAYLYELEDRRIFAVPLFLDGDADSSFEQMDEAPLSLETSKAKDHRVHLLVTGSGDNKPVRVVDLIDLIKDYGTAESVLETLMDNPVIFAGSFATLAEDLLRFAIAQKPVGDSNP